MLDFPKSYDFKRIETEITEFWDREKLVEETTRVDESRPLFSFLEGPPTANAPPGLHHVQSRFYKDLVCRFYYMKGFSVPRKGGWDCHGLPVEVQVEKKLGLTTKKDVISYGIGKFNKLCRDDVFTFIKDWDRMTKRMAFWIDIENPYVTLTNSYIESVWWSLKELYSKGLLYEDYKVIPYCPRCETPLSSHEVALGYQNVTEPSITVKFKLKEENRYVLAWTTTPWTTPSNVALAVGSDIVYVVVEENGVQFILSKKAAERYFQNPVIIQELTGDELVGKEYVPLFDYFVGKLDKPAWKIIATDFVSEEEGTGIVHQSAFGEEDYEAIKKEGLAFLQPVDRSGKFTEDVPDFAGRFVKDADPAIIAQLEKDGNLFKKEDYTHSYPFCWRCQTPLIYYALNSWFVRVTAYKDKLLENNEKINWYPEHIKNGRFGDWLKNVKDWALSRNKFWGTPLPIWKCESCDKVTIIGSLEELEAAADRDLKDLDLHKPAVDKVTFECACGKKMERVPYVIDTWYDSGSATFAQFHYPFENKELFSKLFPYSYITESIDQTRGWFYTLHVLGTLLFDSNAYKSVLVGGLLVDEKGEKMSKTKGNTLNPDEVFDTIGADAVRLQLCATSPDNTKRFGYELVKENITPLLTIFWNSCVFASDLLNSEGTVSKLQLEDRWMISKTNSLIQKVTTELDAKNFHHCFEEIKGFVTEDLSRWYIRLVRTRTDDAVSDTLSYVLDTLTKLLAPFAPYLAEYVYLNLVKGEDKSVHLSKWPEVEKIDEELENKMDIARNVTQAILSAREKIQRGLRWPVKEAFVVSKDNDVAGIIDEMAPLIMNQVNVKKLTVQLEFQESIVTFKPDYAKLGPVYGDATPKIIAHISMKSQEHLLQKINKQGYFELEIDGSKYKVEKEHLIFTTTLPERYDSAEFKLGAVYIDKEVTPDMEAEGFARELARVIQQARKEKGLKKTDSVDMHVKVDVATTQQLQPLKEMMKERIGAKGFVISDSPPLGSAYEVVKVHTIKNIKIEIFFA